MTYVIPLYYFNGAMDTVAHFSVFFSLKINFCDTTQALFVKSCFSKTRYVFSLILAYVHFAVFSICKIPALNFSICKIPALSFSICKIPALNFLETKWWKVSLNLWFLSIKQILKMRVWLWTIRPLLSSFDKMMLASIQRRGIRTQLLNIFFFQLFRL